MNECQAIAKKVMRQIRAYYKVQDSHRALNCSKIEIRNATEYTSVDDVAIQPAA